MRSAIHKSIFVVVAINSIFFSFGCQLFKNQTEYVKPLVDPIQSLDPRLTRFRSDYMITRAIQGQLLKLSATGEVKPGFVESWEFSEKGDSLSFNLRKGVKFHSGREANVDDLIYTFHYLADRDSLISQLFSDIKGFDEYNRREAKTLSGVSRIDTYKVKIDLKSPSFIFLVNLADPKVVLVPKELNGQAPEAFFEHPDGIGPYRFEAMGRGGQELTMFANPTYYEGQPRVQKFHFIVMDQAQAVEKFEAGKVHDLELFTIPLKSSEHLRSLSDLYSVSAYSTSLIFFNGRSGVFKNKDARVAIKQALSLEDLGRDCDLSILKASGFIPHGVTGWSDPQFLMFRKEGNKAVASKNIKSLLPDRPLILLSYGHENSPCIIEKVRRQIEEHLHVKVRNLHVTAPEAIEVLKTGAYDLFFENLSVRGSEPFHLLTYFDPRSPHNLMRFNDPWIIRLTEKIKTSPIKSVRANFYKELDQYMTYEQVYVLPLFSDIRQYFFDRHVHAQTVPATISMTTGFDEVWF